jgi:hypothetical protein
MINDDYGPQAMRVRVDETLHLLRTGRLPREDT